MENLFYEANYMCPNNGKYICSANNKSCLPENCPFLYWAMKLVEDYVSNGVIRQTIDKG